MRSVRFYQLKNYSMKLYHVQGVVTITRTFTVEAESEEQAIEIAQENSNDYDDEEIEEDWSAEQE